MPNDSLVTSLCLSLCSLPPPVRNLANDDANQQHRVGAPRSWPAPQKVHFDCSSPPATDVCLLDQASWRHTHDPLPEFILSQLQGRSTNSDNLLSHAAALFTLLSAPTASPSICGALTPQRYSFPPQRVLSACDRRVPSDLHNLRSQKTQNASENTHLSARNASRFSGSAVQAPDRRARPGDLAAADKAQNPEQHIQ